MRKSTGLLLALLLFISNNILVTAAVGTESVSNEEVQNMASATVTVWYCSTAFYASDSMFDNWQPENFNFNSTIDENNKETVVRFAWLCRMFFDDSFDYGDRYYVAGGDDEFGMLFKVPENVMIETMKKYVVYSDIKSEELPFYDKQAKVFILRAPGGIGGSIPPEKWSVTKKSNGNWLAHFSCPDRYLLDEPYPEMEDVTLELTSDYKVVSINLKVDLKSLQWKTVPKKTVYTTGEALDFDEAILIANHKSGASWEVPITADMVTGYNASQAGSQTVRVSYYNKYLDFQITVQNPPASSGNLANDTTTSENQTDNQVSQPADRIPTQSANAGSFDSLQSGTTVTTESESASSESDTVYLENEAEKAQTTDTIPINTISEKESVFPLWRIIIITGIVLIVGFAVAVVIMIKMGKIPFLKK